MAIGDKDPLRIKGNIKRMIDSQAPEIDINSYLSDEGFNSSEEFVSFTNQGSNMGRTPKIQDAGVIEQARPQERALPGIGQAVGGIAGGVLGSTVGMPGVGAAVGGTIGRTQGLVEEEKLRIMREEPEKRGIIQAGEIAGTLAGMATNNPLIKGVISGAVTTTQMDAEQKKKLGKEILKTGAIETALGGIGAGVSKAGTWLAKGVTEQVLGKNVAQRGFDKGWKTLLDPKFYQNRVPKEIAEKTSKFFDNLSNTTGRGVKNAILRTTRKQGKEGLIDIAPLKTQVMELLPQSGNPEDLLVEFAPKVQKNRIKSLTDRILNIKGSNKSVQELWEIRKDLDRDIYSLSWSDDAMNYLQKLRRTLNAPIKSASPEIAEAFEKYSFVKASEDDMYKKFESVTGLGETYSKNLEQFVSNLLSTNKDETVRHLKALDALNKSGNKVIGDVLDLAAAETLDKGIPDISMFGKIAGGLVGGRKALARIGAIAQEPVAKTAIRSLSRAVPVGISESMREE